MSGLDAKQFVRISVLKPADEADFFSRVFDAPARRVADNVMQIETGRVTVRIEGVENEIDTTRNLIFEIDVRDVNRFAEDVWNRGIKYASRPKNTADGLRRVGFVTPGNIRIHGVGPAKLDSTGAFPTFRAKG